MASPPHHSVPQLPSLKMKMIQINSLASYLSMESPDNICLPSLIFHESDKETRGKMTTSFFLPNHCTTPMQWSTGKEKEIWGWVTRVFCVSELKKKIQNFYFFFSCIILGHQT